MVLHWLESWGVEIAAVVFLEELLTFSSMGRFYVPDHYTETLTQRWHHWTILQNVAMHI